MIMAHASPYFNGRQLNNIREIIPRVAYNGYVLHKNLATFQVACVWRFPCIFSVTWTCNMAYTIKFPTKKVYGNFHVTLWTKAADNLDHQVSTEISIHLLKQKKMYYTFFAKRSRVYRNFHALLKLPLDKRCRYTLAQTCLQKFPCNTYPLRQRFNIHYVFYQKESIEISM